MTAAIDLTGKRFGRLLVLHRQPYNTSENGTVWLCECYCGNKPDVSGHDLRDGKRSSCGCGRITHGHTRGKTAKHGSQFQSREYKTWASMRNRCTNANCLEFSYYGGRGITVCERWLHSFENFLKDMGPRPEGTSIDRIDVNGNYEPGNCRWATQREQQLNRRATRYGVYQGIKRPLKDWCLELGIPYKTLVNHKGLINLDEVVHARKMQGFVTKSLQ